MLFRSKKNNEIKLPEEVKESADFVVKIIDSIYDPNAMRPEDARSNNVELQIDDSKLSMPEFKELWSRINQKSVYVVDFDTDELIKNSIAELDAKLKIPKIYFKVESGKMDEIKSKDEIKTQNLIQNKVA